METPSNTEAFPFAPNYQTVSCPNCGLISRKQVVTIPGARGFGQRVRLNQLIAPFMKDPPMRGHVCDYCRHVFDVTRCRMPMLYYLWVFLLACMMGAVGTLLYLLLCK